MKSINFTVQYNKIQLLMRFHMTSFLHNTWRYPYILFFKIHVFYLTHLSYLSVRLWSFFLLRQKCLKIFVNCHSFNICTLYSFQYLYFIWQFQEERLAAAALLLLPLEKCIDSTIEYTKDRKAFGKSILDNQYVHFRLAELQTEIESLRALVYRATGMNVIQFHHIITWIQGMPMCGIHG